MGRCCAGGSGMSRDAGRARLGYIGRRNAGGTMRGRCREGGEGRREGRFALLPSARPR
jgi:hypothetical protein